jgi:GDP-4-dehydro-6-deoxy-D-mannose reductase
MRVLVTGADGFVGRHLCAHLHQQGDEVVEALGPGAKKVGSNQLKLDVADPKSVLAAVRVAQPEAVVNLAGFSSVAKSNADPSRVWAVNALGPVNLLTAVREVNNKARVLLVGSGEVYGVLPVGVPATEDLPLRPLGSYGSSKVAAEVAGMQFWRAYGSDVVLSRAFNQLGRGQQSDFVVPSLARQIQSIGRRTSEPTIRVGDLQVVRDFLHVEDTVAAYRILLTRGQAGAAYNVCSGVGRTIRSLLDEMLKLVHVEARVEVDSQRLRPSEIPWLVGDARRINELGWRPKSSVTQALKDVLEEQSAER